MVRRGGRSRGCKTCRQRKIKCDEAFPECSQCRQSGRTCPGRVEGLIFISMDEKSQRNKPQKPSHPPPIYGSSAAEQLELVRRDPQSDFGFQLPPEAQSLVAGAAEQSFLGCFISSYHTSLVQWPPGPIQNPTSLPLKFAVRAGSMAFYSNLTKNVALQADARRWYSKAIQLEMARLAVKDSDSKGALKTVNEEHILTPMILALFESALCTSPMGWVHHLAAAAKLLEDLGPERCQTGIMHTLFRTVRLNMVYITTTTRSPCAFASEAWLTIPFLVSPKAPIDELIDVLLYLPCCLATETQLKELDSDCDTTLRKELTEKLADQLGQPIASLATWWAKHHADMIEDHDTSIPFTMPTAAPSPESFTSPKAATNLAYYFTAQLMTSSLFAITEPSSQINDLLVYHASFALSAIAYHRAYGTYSGGTFMMIYPMKVILFRSPCLNQREDTQELLLAWGQERGVEGVCAAGAPMWRRPGHAS